MRHNHHRVASVSQPHNEGEHIGDKLGVQRAGDLVEEKDPWLYDEGASKGRSLSLATGYLVRVALEQPSNLHLLGHLQNLTANGPLANPSAPAQWSSNILLKR